MVGTIFGILTLAALGYGLLTGRGEVLAGAALSGASAAVELTLTLIGIMCLWGGVMRVLRDAGVIGRLARVLRPFLRFFFPESAETEVGEPICANLAANLLGLGNAATPLALSALAGMADRAAEPGVATDDMITLAVLNTAPLSLVPTTLIALRAAAGVAEPFAVVVPVWICSAANFSFALLLTSLCRRINPPGNRTARAGNRPNAGQSVRLSARASSAYEKAGRAPGAPC